MNRQYEQRLRRLEQKENEASAMKKQWLPQWLLDKWSKDYGLPFDTPEKGIESIRRIQKLDKIVVPYDDDCVIEQVDAGSFGEARRKARQGPSLS